MRNLIVCLLLVGVVWVTRGTGAAAEPLIYLGLLMTVPVLAVRLVPATIQASYIGPLAAGVLLAWAGLLSRDGLTALQPYTGLAAVWVGLHLGASLPVSLLRDRRLLGAVLVATACPIVVCFAGVSLLLDLPAGSALLLALLSPVSAPLFLYLTQSHRKQAVWLCVLMTCAGSLVWLLLVQPSGLLPRADSTSAVALLVWLLGIEVLYRGSAAVRSAPGQHLLQGAAALVLSVAAQRWGLPALHVGLASGLMLAVRSPRAPAAQSVTGPIAVLVVPLLLAACAGRLALHLTPGALAACWPLLTVYALSLGLGKLCGIFLAGRLTALPLRDWVQTLPQGIPATLLMLASLPAHVLPAGGTPAAFALGLLALAGVGLSLIAWPIQVLAIRLWHARG